MLSKNGFDYVRPRPITRLPEYAPATARQNTAESLVKRFGMSEAAARALSDAIVDHPSARAAINSPDRRRVPGGELIALRADVWTRKVVSDPSNMRIGPAKVHPIAVTPGTAGEDSRFAPIPAPASDPSGRPELVCEVESREHLEWAHDKAADFVLRVNDWRDSISVQGVMEEVWITAVTYTFADGSPPVVAPQTSEGSSRTTGCRTLIGARPVDDIFNLSDATLRAHIRRLNDSFELSSLTEDDEKVVRAFIMPALIVVGFEPVDPNDAPPFHVGVQSMVALRHVEPPEPWGEASTMDALADAALDEMVRRRVIKPAERRWLQGAMTREESERSHFSQDAGVRAARIIGLFTSQDSAVQAAIRSAVTGQSTRQRIGTKLKDRMASALIMRAVADGARQRERIRRYMTVAVAQDWHRRPWVPSQRGVQELEEAALLEVQSVSSPDADPGPATVELAARAMYPLIAGLHLHADRGTLHNDQPDRRNPGEVLNTMRHSVHGVRQLAQAVRDSSANMRVRAVNADGGLLPDGNGGRVKVVTDRDLRITFPAPGKPTKAAGPADTPHKLLTNALAELGEAIGATEAKAEAAAKVAGHTGLPLIEEEGVAPSHVVAWVRALEQLRDRLQRWRWVAEQRQPTPPTTDNEVGPEVSDFEDMDLDDLIVEAERAGIEVGDDPDREELIDLLVESEEAE